MTPQRMAALRALLNAATPGPWYAVQRDDGTCMQQRLVATVPRMDDREDDAGDFAGGSCSEPEIVAGTLVQRPLAIAHASTRWDADAEFIATARMALPEALDEIEKLRGAIIVALAAGRELKETVEMMKALLKRDGNGLDSIAAEIIESLRAEGYTITKTGRG